MSTVTPSPSPSPSVESSSGGKKGKRTIEFPSWKRHKKDKDKLKSSTQVGPISPPAIEKESKKLSPHPHRRSATFTAKVRFGSDSDGDDMSNPPDNMPPGRPDTADLFRTDTPASIMDLIDNDSGESYRHAVSDHIADILMRLGSADMRTRGSSTSEESTSLTDIKHLLDLAHRQVKRMEDEMASRATTSNELQWQLQEMPQHKRVSPDIEGQLTAVSDSIRRLDDMNISLKKRLQQFSKAQKTSDLLKKRIYHLEQEKEGLIRTNTELSTRTGSSTDLDIADLQHSNSQLREMLSELETKLEQQKIETRDQKERLVLKLFEIETVSLKAHEHQADREFLALEHEQIFKKKPTAGGSRPRSASPEPGTALGKAHHRLKQTQAELQMQKAMMKQLELQNEQARGLVSSLLDQRLDLERQLEESNVKRPKSILSEANIQIMGVTSSEVENLRAKNAALQKELIEARGSDSQIEKMAEEQKSLAKQVSEREKDLTALHDIIQHNEEEQAKLVGELNGLHEVVEEIHQVRLDNQHIQQERDELDASLSRQQQRLSQLEVELSEAYQKVGQSQKEAIDMRIALQEFQIDRESKAQEIERLHSSVNENSAAVTENKALHEEINKLKSLIQKHEIDIYQLREDMCTKDNAADEMSKQLQDTEQRMMELQKEFERLEEDRSELQEKLRESCKDLEEEKLQLAKQLKESDGDRLSLKTEAENLRKRLLTLTDDLSQLLSDKRILEKKVEALSSESPLLMKQRTDLLVSKERAEHQVQDLKKDLESSQQRLADMVLEHSRLEAKLKSSSESLQSSEKEKSMGDSKIESLLGELDRAKSTIIAKDAVTRELSSEVESSKKQSEQLSKQASDLHRDKAKLEITCRDAERQVQALNQRAENAESTLKKVTAEDIPSYHKQLSELHIEKLKVSGEVSILTTKLEGVNKENDRLSTQLEELRADLGAKTEEHKVSVAKYEQELREMRHDLSQQQVLVRKLEDSVASLKADKDQSERAVSELKETVADRDSDLSRLRKRMDKVKGEHEHMSQEYVGLEDRNKTLVSELSRAEAKLVDLQAQLQSSSDDKDQVVVTLQTHVRKLEAAQTQLKQEKEGELEKLRKSLTEASSNAGRHEAESLRKELDISAAENEQLKSRLELSKKWEPQYRHLSDDYNTLRKTVQDTMNKSSQFQADNKDLLYLLSQARDEMPDESRGEAFRKLQEENERLEKEVSLISHWNESKAQEIHHLEDNLKQLTKSHKAGVESMAKENERRVQLLQRELNEVESECKKLRQRLSGEEFEEYKTKLVTQQTLLAHLSEHNAMLQSHVDALTKQIADLGQTPPPSPCMSFSVPMAFDFMGGEESNGHAQKTNLREKDSKERKRSWKKRSRSVTPTHHLSVAGPDSVHNGVAHKETEVDDLKAENIFLRSKLKELQEQFCASSKP